MTNVRLWAFLLILGAILAGCTTTPTAECAIDLYAPLDAAELKKMSIEHIRWHDGVESAADRICK